MTGYKDEEEDDHFDQEYLHQKLNKCKSQEQLKHLTQKPKKKKQKNVRTLVAHPPIPKKYNKAKNAAEKQLTRDIKSTIQGSRKPFDKQNINFGSPAGKDQIDRKKR